MVGDAREDEVPDENRDAKRAIRGPLLLETDDSASDGRLWTFAVDRPPDWAPFLRKRLDEGAISLLAPCRGRIDAPSFKMASQEASCMAFDSSKAGTNCRTP